MAKKIIRRTSQQVRDELALLEALEPIEDAHLAAKEALWAARASGDPAAIRAAREAKIAAANRLEETRTWLRREAAIVELRERLIPRLEARLARPMLVKAGTDAREDAKARAQTEAALAKARADLVEMTAEAEALRRELAALGGEVVGDPAPLDLPPGSADVTLPTITTTPTVNQRKSRGAA